jgi:predicted nucleic acid-binding Zn ribbon protein
VVKVIQIKLGVKIPCFPPLSQPVIASKGDATIFATGSYHCRTMPVYEYESQEDGSVIELIRPMSQADAPVEDPDGKGRTFKRKHSVFSAAGTAAGSSGGVGGGGGCCPCGKGAGACSRNN